MRHQLKVDANTPATDFRAIAGFEQAAVARSRFFTSCLAPVDIASIVFFRVCFGALMFIEVVRYFKHGWIQEYYIAPAFHFTYLGFEWVRSWPGIGMYLHFCALGVLSICIMLGFKYRASMFLFGLGFTYVFLLEKARYLNHFYLIILISFLMVLVPAHKALSIDAANRKWARLSVVPAWTIWLLRAQLSIVYFYAGVAKLNGDWLRGEPMRTWLAETTNLPVVGHLLANDCVAYAASYGGLLFDLLIAPMLLWRRTRCFAFTAAILFHLMNGKLFSIGIFPYFMIAATTLFLTPGWPRLFSMALEPPDRAGAARSYVIAWWRFVMICNRVCAGSISLIREMTEGLFPNTEQPAWCESEVPLIRVSKAQLFAVWVCAIFLLAQILLPLRHFLYTGNVSWTEEGDKFSWHMKLKDKRGEVCLIATDPETGASREIRARDYLTSLQISAMDGTPDMIQEFSHYLADKIERKEGKRVEIHAWAETSLNGRAPQLLIDPEVNLAALPRTLGPANWICPLVTPLRE